jgi:hypothetical protein
MAALRLHVIHRPVQFREIQFLTEVLTTYGGNRHLLITVILRRCAHPTRETDVSQVLEVFQFAGLNRRS